MRIEVTNHMLRNILVLVLLSSVLALATPGEHLEVGSKLPSIKERDQNGQKLKLKKLRGREGTLLVVFRSADW